LVKSTIDFAAMREAVLDVIDLYGLPSRIIDPKASSSISINAAWKHLSTILDEDGLLDFEIRIENASSEVEMWYVGETTEVPGTTTALLDLRSKGYRTGILTRGSREYVEAALNVSKIPFASEHIVCRDDHRLLEAKPNPIALFRAARLLGLEPDDCIYVGDHWMDHDCAISAGMPFIGVLSGHNDRERWNGNEQTMIVNNISELANMIGEIRAP
jgi:HAD superfamily hydrolase (TIGR01549 family)